MTAIDQKYAALGGPGGWLGQPTDVEHPTPDTPGAYRHYQHGSIYWSAQTNAHEAHGAIRGLWSQLGWERSFLGFPQTDETATPDGAGRYNHFQGGSIYWTPQTGAHEVHGAIRALWSARGWERSFLGYPLTDETMTPDRAGRYNHFQGGSIYWTPQTGAHETHGAIRGLWSQLGWERSFLGYPLTDETTTPDGIGRYNHFQGGSIYWTPQTGAHEVHGAIRQLWSQLSWERGWLGYPTSNELVTPDGVGRVSRFQHGSIYWSPATGAIAVKQVVRVHAKVLTTPSVAIADMIAAMQTVYGSAQIGVELASVETLNLPALNDLDVGDCIMGQSTAEQNDLYKNHRSNVGAADVAVYFVRSTNPAYNGCAAYPSGSPSACVAQYATKWTLGHEVGHVLGLHHVESTDQLMYGHGTANLTNPPPDLSASEITTMLASGLTT